MTKDKKGLGIVLLIAGFILFSSFVSKPKTKHKGAVYVDQVDAPAGSKQCYSNVGTQVYDLNGNLIYTYDTANIGMTITGESGTFYNIVFGDSFAGGLPGLVNKNDIQTI